ncbi:MAG TPA: hypothetical protein PKY82_31455 [Pyrinomonadaceae bacterium]|nr:hypothetical protein [Pyrinomonadaceae bacterium]
MFSTFPDGTAGLGLLLLRATLGITSFWQGSFYLFAKENSQNWFWVFGLLASIIGALLLAGFLTPLFSSMVCLASIFLMVFPFSANNPGIFTLGFIIVISLSIILLGPGAFSLDARMFGRREIIIPNNPRISKKSE